jgi:RHS repeat-associated protein
MRSVIAVFRVLRRHARVIVLSIAAVLAVALPTALAQSGHALPDHVAKSRDLGREEKAAGRGERELVNLRTRTSKTFVTRDGRRVARVYTGSVHYRDDGRWRNVDTRLLRSGDSYVSRGTAFDARLPVRLEDGGVRVRKGKGAVSLRLRGARGVARADGSEVTYRDALFGVDVAYRVLGDSVKEFLTIGGPASQRRFQYDLTATAGLTPRLLPSEGIIFKDARRRTRVTIAAPFAVDADNATKRVGLRLRRTGSRSWRLVTTVSRRWLGRNGRAWPVVVDPSLAPNPDRDCYLDASQPEGSFCGADFMKIGPVGGHDHHAVLHFDLKSIPRGADLHGASLVMKTTSYENANFNELELFPLTEEWTSAASWNRKDGVDRWSDLGGDADTGAKAEYTDGVGGGVPVGERYWHPFKIVREWLSGKRPNHGFLVKPKTQANGGFFASNEALNAADRPYLNVHYTERTGERRGYVFERQQLSDRISLGVNVANGNLMVRQKDFSMPGGLGPDVAVSRSYNSLRPERGAFGQGWTLDSGQDFVLAQHAGKKYMVFQGPSGVQAAYERDAQTGNYKTPAGFDNKLAENADGTWTITENESQAKLHFDTIANGNRLMDFSDRNGRKVTLTYKASGAIDKITDSNGDAVTFTSADRFTTNGFTDPASRGVSYTYDAGLRLATYTDAAGKITRYEYNGPGGKMSKVTTPGGRITTIAYYPTGDPLAGKVKSVTRVTNTTNLTGSTWSFDYRIRRNGSGEAEVTDPIGTQSTDENDRITRYDFDDSGRVTKTTDALGREASRKLTSTSKVESYTAPSNTGSTPNTSFTYDSSTDTVTGSDTTTGGGFGTINSSARYNESGRVGAGTPGGQFLRTSQTSGQGNETQMSYVPPAGAPADTSGNLYSMKQGNGSGGTAGQVDFRYDTAPDGKGGRLVGVKDGRGNETTYGYDAKGNANRINVPQPATANGVLPGPTDITYHSTLARVEKVQDGARNWRCLGYDNLDRVTAIRFSTDSVCDDTDDYVKFTYDADGNLTQEVDKANGTSTYVYDSLNRLTSESLPGARSNTYTYDRNGNMTSLTDGGGKVEYAYNAVNQVRAAYEPGTTKPTKFTYDEDNRRTKTAYPNGVEVKVEWDDASRVDRITTTKGSSKLQDFLFDYRKGGQETWLRTLMRDDVASPNRRTAYAYDSLDRLVRARTEDAAVLPPPGPDKRPQGRTRGTRGVFTRGPLARTTGGTPETTPCTTVAGFACYEYTLDAAGNRLKERVTGSQVTDRVTSYGYNKANQLCWWIGSDQAVSGTSDCPARPTGANVPTYDANGNETSNGAGRSAAYNRRDQTTSFTIGGQATNMTYLGAGQERWTGEGTNAFQHNVLGLGSRGTTYFTRVEDGTPVSNRTGTARLYYLLDPIGSVTGLTDANGSVVKTYRYEPFGKIESQTGTASDPLRFAGGYEGVGNLLHFGQRYYDPNLGRWTQMDPLNQASDLREANRYVYVGADPINATDPSGLLSLSLEVDVGIPGTQIGFGGGVEIADNGISLSGSTGTGGGIGAAAKIKPAGKAQDRAGTVGGGCVGVKVVGCYEQDEEGGEAGVGVGTPEAHYSYEVEKKVVGW